MQRYRSAETRNHDALPLVGYDWEDGQRIAATKDAAGSVTVYDGAYLITSNAPVYLSCAGEAGDVAGSTYLPAGLPFHVLLGPSYLGYEHTISVRAVDTDASVFVLPLA